MGESFIERKQSANIVPDTLRGMMDPGAERLRRTVHSSRTRELLRVREARTSDLDSMVVLLGHLFKQETDFAPAPGKQRKALEIILSQPALGHLFVLTRGGEVLGMVSLLFTISTAEGGKAAWLEDLVVQPDQRDRGLGTRLLRAAVAWAKKEGITRITLLTDSDNLHARRLYLRHGFVGSGMQPLRLYLSRKAPPRALALSLA